MSDRHIVLKSDGKKWSAAYSDQPEVGFDGETMQTAIGALMDAKGRRDPKQSAAEIDVADMLARSQRLDDGAGA